MIAFGRRRRRNVSTWGPRFRVVLSLLVIAPAAHPGAPGAPLEATVPIQGPPPRWQLAAAFVKRDSTALRRFLAPDVMIWPPAPDTARRGSAAVAYFVRLALASQVTHSEFAPLSVTTDGPNVTEEGTWSFTHRRVKVRTRYDLRWRQKDGRWQVSFLRWDLFY